MSFSKEINIAIVRNLKLKSGILAVIFSLILLLQVCMMLFGDIFEKLAANYQNKWIFTLGPLTLLIAAISEVLAFRYMKIILSKNLHLSRTSTYLIVFIETSFPSITLFLCLRHPFEKQMAVISLENALLKNIQ